MSLNKDELYFHMFVQLDLNIIENERSMQLLKTDTSVWTTQVVSV